MFSGRDDVMWAQLRAGLTDQFPNPRREGCPGDSVVKAIAFRRLPLSASQKWLDHFGQCSPCFRDFERFQSEARRQWKWKLTLGIAASLILFLSVIVRFTSHSRKILPSESLSQASVSQVGQVAPIAMRLNLSDTDAFRGAGRPVIEHLLRRRLALAVHLPSYISSGECNLQLVKDISDKVPLMSLAGSVRRENGVPVLHLAPDLSDLTPGTYVVRFRLPKTDWQYARVIVD